MVFCGFFLSLVAPYTGAWIEILKVIRFLLKFQNVAPYTGAWIEMIGTQNHISTISVAPYTGAWIEIENDEIIFFLSHVAPYTGAWIEIPSYIAKQMGW